MNTYPFLLGSPSFVYHADILTNVKQLAPVVDDMELVLFVVDEENNLPSDDLIHEINTIAGQNEMGFTIHLPLGLAFGDKDDKKRSDSIRLASDIIHLTRELHPHGYVLHIDSPSKQHITDPGEWTSLIERSVYSLKTLSDGSVSSEKLCIENLEAYDITLLEIVLDKVPVSLCLDIGHLWFQRIDPVQCIKKYGERIRIIHLHAIAERDHSSLIHAEKKEVYRVLDALAHINFTGVLTLEVFNVNDLFSSIKVIDEWAAAGR